MKPLALDPDRNEWRISICDINGREIDGLTINADNWPAALTRSAQFYVTSKAMLADHPVAVEIRVRQMVEVVA